MSAAPAKAAPVPPCSIETEQALLGALLVDNRLIDVVLAEIEPGHFFDPCHQRIFKIMAAAFGRDAFVLTPLTLHAAMKADPGLIELGGHRYFVNLIEAAPALPPVRDFCRILRDMALRRDLVAVGEGLAEEAALDGPGASGQAVAAAVVDELLRLGESRARGPSSLAAVAQRSVLAAEERLGGKPVPSLSTGLVKLDRALGGMQPGDRIGIPARTGMGKSLSMSAIINGAAPSGAPIFIASGDMREKQWADRALCDIDQRLNPHLRPIYYSKFRNGTLSNDEVGRIQMAQREMADWAIEIDDNPEISIPALRGRVRAMARRYPGRQGILGVDFLQKVKASGKDRRRDEDITDAAYALGDIVRDVGWTLLVLIQLKNKNTDGKGDLREDPPNVTDIRECVTGDTTVVDARTGDKILVRDLRPGTAILGLDQSQKTASGVVSDVWKTGEKPVFDLVTRSGHRLRATGNHPIFTARGWVNLSDIQPDDLVACNFRFCDHGREMPRYADLCRLLGYMTGDGTMQKSRNPGLIISEPSAFADAIGIINRAFPSLLIHKRRGKYNDAWFSNETGRAKGTKRAKNPITEWFKEIGVHGSRDYNKFVPAFVFKSGKIGAIEFLNGYLATDGCVSRDEVRFDTTSLQLAQDVVHLLKRLQIASSVSSGYQAKHATRKIYRVVVAYEHRVLVAETLTVRGIRGLKLRALGKKLRSAPKKTTNSIFSLPREVALMATELTGRKYQNKRLSRRHGAEIVKATGNAEIRKWVESDVIWDRIRYVSPAGTETVYDLTVPSLGTFLANGVAVHNSGGVEMAMDVIMSPFRRAFFIERREPEGRNAPGGATPEWLSWWGEYQQHEHHLRMLGWKNRDGRAADLNLDLWCDPGCAAIRDEKPGAPRDETANLLPYAPGRSG